MSNGRTERVLRMMDLRSFSQHGPWPWFLSDTVLERSRLDELVRTFPEERLVLSERKEGSDKTYLCQQYRLYSDYAKDADEASLHPAWAELLTYVTSQEYRDSVSAMLDCDLSSAGVEAILNQYDKECYMSPHTDRHPKLITHLIYLSGAKGADLGGEFVVHGQDGGIAHMVEPIAGRSVLFKRSDESLHSVNVIKAVHKRRSLQIVFWEYEPAATLPGRMLSKS